MIQDISKTKRRRIGRRDYSKIELELLDNKISREATLRGCGMEEYKVL